MNTVLDELNFLTDSLNTHRDESAVSQSIDFLEKFKSEAERAKLQIRHNISSFDNKVGVITNYLSFLQNQVTNISNRINNITPGFSYGSEIVHDLLDFLIHEFEPYFSFNLKAPASYISAKVSSYAALANKINAVVTDKGVDTMLAKLIKDYMNQNGYIIKTFAQLHYYQEFCEGMHVVCLELSEINLQVRIIYKLVHLNFNSPAFLRYCVSTFAKQYDEERELEEWIQQINALERKIQRAPQHEILSYDQSDKSIKDMMLSVAGQKTNEIKALKTQRVEQTFFDEDEPYFRVKMTIYQITFLIRLLYDAGFLTVKYNKFLHRFIAKYLRTENKSDNLSESSIKNKYNVITERTVDDVKKILTKLLEKCNNFKRKGI